MSRSISLLAFLSVLLLAPAAPAQSPNGGDAAAAAPSNLTLAKLVAVRNLRCDAKNRGKQARLRADIHRAEQAGAMGPYKITIETQVRQAEAEAGAAFEEAGSLKRRLESMLERYIADHRLRWYQSPDEAERVRLEDLIGGAREIADDACNG